MKKRPKRVSRNATRMMSRTLLREAQYLRKLANTMYVQFLRKEIMYQNIIQHVLNS